MFRVRGKWVATNNKLAPLAPVILGLVPRIFWQRVSNLVNKFALLLNKCWLREDSWDKPKNDWCRERVLSAFCMFFKYPSPDAKALPSPSRGEGFVRLLRRCTPRNDACSVGRSMIEMLGVLAIIAVLTVGGIAGYSKAMKKYQANKVVGEIIQVLVKFKELSENDKFYNIYSLDDETKKTLGLCLPSAENCSGYQRTPVGNISIHGNIFINEADAELCISAFNNIVTPLKGNIKEFSVSTVIKNRDDSMNEMDECYKKCKDKCKTDMDCRYECDNKCYEDNNPYTNICISEDKKNCSNSKYINLYDSRVVTEINAACNSGLNKKASSIQIIFKNGFAIE